MVKFQGKSGRKLTGGRLHISSQKKKRELGRNPAETTINEERKKVIRTLGGNLKYRLFRANKANVIDPKTGKSKSVTIKDVVTNPASRDYSRRRVITKGAILDTEIGHAKVTNRPGNEGFINAILIKD